MATQIKLLDTPVVKEKTPKKDYYVKGVGKVYPCVVKRRVYKDLDESEGAKSSITFQLPNLVKGFLRGMSTEARCSESELMRTLIGMSLSALINELVNSPEGNRLIKKDGRVTKADMIKIQNQIEDMVWQDLPASLKNTK